METGSIRVFVYDAGQCSPKKCTGRKMVRKGHAKGIDKMGQIPPHAIVLSPLAVKALSRQDLPIAQVHGLVVCDCSWNEADPIFDLLHKKTIEARALPYLIPVNPINFGHPFKLSSIEATAAALFIMGDRDGAEALLSLYQWGPNFLTMNKEPLEEYSSASNSIEVVKIQKGFMPEDEEPLD